ncbi:MAG: O-antigen ligase family protein, partial [Thermoguttaceae bacterium]|nr:O-antigen ligase family protein [Thermoguttaceae bacterium]
MTNVVRRRKRFDPARIADFGVAATLAWATISYVKHVACGDCEVRLATNAFWTFMAPLGLYVILRKFRAIFTNRLTSALCVILVACATSEALYSAYSFAVVNPRLRAEYRANPDAMLAQNGMNLAPGSRERLLFEQRLLESSEPTGTYGLANTLAGVLAPSLVLCAAFFTAGATSRRREEPQNAAFSGRAAQLISATIWGAAAAAIGFALVATKSRAGLLAAIFGIGVWATLKFGMVFHRRASLRRVVFGGVGIVLACVLSIACAFACGVLDREVFSEAGKSLGYRLDYWRATAAMIKDFPIFGIGPGEFQSVYPQYIVPTASEFIADPHNFAFELAALFGIPLLLSFGLFLLGIF